MKDDYSAHLYLPLDAADRDKQIEKEQMGADKMNSYRLIHPHHHNESCGNMKHLRIIPHQDPEEVRIISG